MAAGPTLSSSTAHLDHPPGWRSALSLGCRWGKGEAVASSGPEPLDTGLFSLSLHPHYLQPAQGWGPEGSVQGRGWSQRTASGTGRGTEEAK